MKDSIEKKFEQIFNAIKDEDIINKEELSNMDKVLIEKIFQAFEL